MMTVVDANLLLYAYDSASGFHAPAKRWLEQTLSGQLPVGLPWTSISAFVRISTNARLSGTRFTVEESARIVDAWLDRPCVIALGYEDGHWAHFREMLVRGQAAGPLASDAQLAALTIGAGGVLHTTDRDFARFPGLRWKNPLVPANGGAAR